MHGNYKKQYIEILDYYPYIIRSEIPIFHIIAFITYIFASLIHIIKVKLKFKKPFKEYFKKKNKEVIEGAEITLSSFFSLSGEKVELPKENVIKTENIFLYNKDAKNFMKELIKSGEFSDIDRLISGKFLIKIKTITCSTPCAETDKREVVFSYPKPAMEVYKLLKPILKNGGIK